MSNLAQEIYESLRTHYGPQGWWPAETPLEVAVGAILTQNTQWGNVERAITRLRSARLLTSVALASVDRGQLEELVRPAGYFRQKARRLQEFSQFLVREHDGALEGLFQQGVAAAREQLLQLNGIGPETADSILLYAGQLPSFVVDTYTARILKRHGWIDDEAGYYELQDWFVAQLPEDTQQWNEYHALIVRVGKEHCGSRAKCDGCPLQYRLERPLETSME